MDALPENEKPTKEEMAEVIRNGDDRQDNILVVDENGYINLVQSNQMLYPVRSEIWKKGNKYVGKYSSMEHLDETYNCMLSHCCPLKKELNRLESA